MTGVGDEGSGVSRVLVESQGRGRRRMSYSSKEEGVRRDGRKVWTGVDKYEEGGRGREE